MQPVVSLKLFISYTRVDRPKLQALLDGLRRLGHNVWFDEQLMGGDVWWAAILKRIRGTDGLLFALSPGFLESTASLEEVRYALALGKPVVPVMVESIAHKPLPEDLAILQIVDFTSPGERAAFDLVAAIANVRPAGALRDPLPPDPPTPLSDAYQMEHVMRDASRLVPDVDSRGSWLRTLAVGGMADKALEAVQNVRVVEQRVRALASIVQGLAAAGERKAACDIARSAATTARRIPAAESFVHGRAVAGAVTALCAAGLPEVALELTMQSRDDDELRAHCLIVVATTLAESGRADEAGRQYESALRCARRVANDYARSDVLVHAIRTLTLLGRHEEAVSLASSLVGFNRSWGLARAAAGLGEAGHFDDAIRVADGLSDGFSRETALVDIAEELRRAGQPNRIEYIAGLLHSPERRAEVLASAAAAHNRLGNEVAATEQLEALMRTIPAHAQTHVLAGIAERLDDGGLTAAARDLASAAERVTETMANYSDEKNYALARCVDLFARIGDLSHARDLAERCQDGDQRLQAYASILSAWLAKTRPELRDALRPQ